MPPDQATLTPPILTRQVELSASIDSIDGRHSDGGRYAWALVLVRLHGAPLGSLVMALPEGSLSGETVRSLAEAELAAEISYHLAADCASGADTAAGRPSTAPTA